MLDDIDHRRWKCCGLRIGFSDSRQLLTTRSSTSLLLTIQQNNAIFLRKVNKVTMVGPSPHKPRRKVKKSGNGNGNGNGSEVSSVTASVRTFGGVKDFLFWIFPSVICMIRRHQSKNHCLFADETLSSSKFLPNKATTDSDL